MPSIVQTSWRTKQVNTYGRRTRNVVPIFTPIMSGEENGDSKDSVGAQDDAMSDGSLDILENSTKARFRKRARLSSRSRVGSIKGSRTLERPQKKSVSASHSKCKAVSARSVVDNSDSRSPVTRSNLASNRSNCSTDVGRSVSNSRKWSPGLRIPLGSIRPPNTPSRKLIPNINCVPESLAFSDEIPESHASIAKKLAKAAPALKAWRERNERATPIKSSPAVQKQATLKPASRKAAPRISPRLSIPKGKGLAPSHTQCKASLKIEIIELDSGGETVDIEIRQRKPVVKSLGKARMIVVSDDESDEKHGPPNGTRPTVSDEESFDADQLNMPWNAAVPGVPMWGSVPKGGKCALKGSEKTSIPPAPPRNYQVPRPIPSIPNASLAQPPRPPHTITCQIPGNPPPNCLKPDFPPTPADDHFLTRRYEEVTAKLLMKVPEIIRLKFLQTRDPRLLFSHVESQNQKKILTDWLEANYFIPTSPDTVVRSYSARDSSETLGHHEPSTAMPHPSISQSKLDIISISSDGDDNERDVNGADEIATHIPKGLIDELSGLLSSDSGNLLPLIQDFADVDHNRTRDALSPSLLELLRICGQEEPLDFESFVATFPFDKDIQNLVSVDMHVHDVDLNFRKVGEASFSEVYRVGNVVLKIIPITSTLDSGRRGDLRRCPNISAVEDVLREVRATERVGVSHPGFTRLLKTFLVRGHYPELLLDEWDAYDERKGSENHSPEFLPADQEYVVIVLPHGGPDLETVALTAQRSKRRCTWRQCANIFWQVCEALAAAEEFMGFEHRDLHWGQILIEERNQMKSRRNLPFNDPSFQGLKATIIDFGLSRMSIAQMDKVSHTSHYVEFDDVIFKGKGDYQFEVYRMMKRHNSNDWEKYSPLTNVMWLHYLSLKIFRAFNLKEPAPVRKGSSERDCWDCLVEVERYLDAAVSHLRDSGHRRKKLSKTQVAVETPASASDVFSWGKTRGWVW
ncbi:uncharacterized protein EI90DRAFT_3150429 [Cantharellus anzutake]|uniref:uncharacterized protein n=1 Tax=Cantharellus anzutake TaxID=1750568 RepID=UPI00190385A0|nr:uncharacterized protein EI90DRAFT_3150429 [Cantharellus anzutake]KAF8341263.1 hypothetical protein EI90DRAFT_3150429 [Cantharellus anzutake]